MRTPSPSLASSQQHAARVWYGSRWRGLVLTVLASEADGDDFRLGLRRGREKVFGMG